MIFIWVCALVFLVASDALATTLMLEPVSDNTLYQDIEGDVSNGAGEHVFAGKTALEKVHRGLLRFDVANGLPAYAVIASVRLTVNVSRVSGGDTALTLHRVLAEWGEGTSNATGEEGQGAPATPQDATWLHRFYPNEIWNEVGGDFEVIPSASTIVGAVGVYTWESTPQMIDDVQSWRVDPATNFGWLVRGEEGLAATSKRFDSRENSPSVRPQLVIEYSIPVSAPPSGHLESWGRLKFRYRRG